MAVFRLHKKQWDTGFKPPLPTSKKRKRDDADVDGTGDEEALAVSSREEFPGGGRKGVSSGLSVIVKRGGSRSTNSGDSKKKWWKELRRSDSKMTMKV
jgi:RNA exonuclease 4